MTNLQPERKVSRKCDSESKGTARCYQRTGRVVGESQSDKAGHLDRSPTETES